MNYVNVCYLGRNKTTCSFYTVLHLKPVSVELVLQNVNIDGLRDVKLFIWQLINLLL